jgi:hypothetical protein
MGLLRLGRDGREVARMPVIPRTHLMDFAADGARPVAYTSTCGPPAIHRIEVARSRQKTQTSGSICGVPLTVQEDCFLVLAAFRLNKQREPARFSGRPQRLALIDLEAPASAKRVPRRGAPLDAVVVE